MLSVSCLPSCLHRQFQGKCLSITLDCVSKTHSALAQESMESTYRMEDESIPLIEKMLDFLYTGDYSDSASDSSTSTSTGEAVPPMSSLRLHAQLFALGDKYCIPELCDIATEKFSARLKTECDPLDYLDSISDVFFSPLSHNDRLKKLVVLYSRNNLRDQLQHASVRAKYNSIAAETPDFVKELLDTYLDAPLLGDCANCGRAKPMSALQVRCQKCGRGKGTL